MLQTELAFRSLCKVGQSTQNYLQPEFLDVRSGEPVYLPTKRHQPTAPTWQAQGQEEALNRSPFAFQIKS